MTDHDQPFDQSLYDAVMDYDLEGDPRPAIDDPYEEGYRDAARIAARIAAERQRAPVGGDYDYVGQVIDAAMFVGDILPEQVARDAIEAAVQVGIVTYAALGPQVPAIPELPGEWALETIQRYEGDDDDFHEATLTRKFRQGRRNIVDAQGPTWHEALTTDIAAAQEADT